MRLPEDKIKAAILHPDVDIRDRAIDYFAKSYSSDLSVMPLIIQAMKTFPKQDSVYVLCAARELPQTPETLAWVIDELNVEQNAEFPSNTYNLSMILVHADPRLLLPWESAVLKARHFDSDLSEAFSERLRLHSWDEETCWRKLEEFCEAGQDADCEEDAHLDHGFRIVESLVRFGDRSLEKVHAALSQRVDHDQKTPWRWMQPLAARLAGLAKLEATTGLLIGHLSEDESGMIDDECTEALIHIGTPAVIAAIASTYFKAPDRFAAAAATLLEDIHSDFAVETCLQLLRREDDEYFQFNLARALLSQFASEGIDESRKLLVGHAQDFTSRDLREYLLQTCTLMDQRFPEYDEWVAAAKAETEHFLNRVKELKDDPAALLRLAMERVSGAKAADITIPRPPVPRPPAPRPPALLPARPILAPPPASKQKIGRNERCPCGSGKKFKQCCLRKTGGLGGE